MFFDVGVYPSLLVGEGDKKGKATLQLDAILQNAKVSFVDKPKSGNRQQSKFERILGMTYLCPGIGEVQLMVGVRKRDKTKVQYCITAMTPVLKHTKKGSR